jgi:hypothetical protein
LEHVVRSVGVMTSPRGIPEFYTTAAGALSQSGFNASKLASDSDSDPANGRDQLAVIVQRTFRDIPINQ